MIKINLLPDRSQLQLKQLERVKVVNNLSLILLALFVLAAGVVFAFEFYLKSQITGNKAKLQAAKQEFSQFTPELDELQNLRFRVKLVASVLEGRKSFSEDFENFEAVAGDEIELKDLVIESGLIDASGAFKGLTSLENFENNIEKSSYDLVEFNRLGVSEEGGFNFNVVFDTSI